MFYLIEDESEVMMKRSSLSFFIIYLFSCILFKSFRIGFQQAKFLFCVVNLLIHYSFHFPAVFSTRESSSIVMKNHFCQRTASITAKAMPVIRYLFVKKFREVFCIFMICKDINCLIPSIISSNKFFGYSTFQI